MQADLPLSERQRLEAEDQREIRAALVRCHATVPDEEFAIEATQTAMTVDSPAYRAMAARLRS